MLIDNGCLKKSIMTLLFRNDVNDDWNNDIDLASRKAYADMASHTLHLNNPEKKEELKDEGCRVLREAIRNECKSIIDAKQFDDWHRSVCYRLQDTYKGHIKDAVSITFGQAQKWLNMTIKYYYIICEINNREDHVDLPFFQFAHVPVDSIMYDVIEKELEIKKPEVAWSKLDDYDMYLDYQKTIREKVPALEECYNKKWPLAWEMNNWEPR